MPDDLTALLRRKMPEEVECESGVYEPVAAEEWDVLAARLAEVVEQWAGKDDELSAFRRALDEAVRAHVRDLDQMREDVGKLGEALGHPDVARPISPHEVMERFTGEVAEAVGLLRDLRYWVATCHRLGIPLDPEGPTGAQLGAYLARRKEASR